MEGTLTFYFLQRNHILRGNEISSPKVPLVQSSQILFSLVTLFQLPVSEEVTYLLLKNSAQDIKM